MIILYVIGKNASVAPRKIKKNKCSSGINGKAKSKTPTTEQEGIRMASIDAQSIVNQTLVLSFPRGLV